MLSLAQIVLCGNPISENPLPFGKRLDCVRFYFNASGIHRLHASPSRSGSLWTQLGLALAIDLANGGDGEYVFCDGIYIPRDGLAYRLLDWRIPTGDVNSLWSRSDGPVLGNQLFYLCRLPYYKARSAQLKNMDVVLVTRSILATLESRFFKFAASNLKPDVILDNENTFDWDRYLNDAINFFNSWGDALSWHPSIRHYTFENLKADPVAGHMEMLNFWGFEIPEECVAEGLRRASKKEMLKRMPGVDSENNERLSTRGKSKRGIISETRKRHIVDRLKRELIHDFGYSFEYDTDYGIAYD